MRSAATLTREKVSTVEVLHVDDEPDFMEIAAEYLERENPRFEVSTATSVDEALDVLGDKEEDAGVDCVVSDYSMPEKNGVEFLKQVRDSYPDLPFILFTGKGSEEVASEAISAGVTDYLRKESGTDHYTVLANSIENAVDARRNERELHETSKQLRAVLDTVSAAVSMKDTDGRYLLMNENCAEELGVKEEEEIIGLTDYDLFPDDVADRIRKDDERVFEKEDAIEVEEEIPTQDGVKTFLTLKSPVFDEGGEPCAVCGVSTDITERKDLRRLSEEYTTVFENVQDPMFLVSVEGDGEEFFINRLNPAYEEKVGITEEEASGKTPRELFGDEDGAKIEENYRRCVEEGETLSYEETLETPVGTRTYHTKISPVCVDDEVTRIVGSARDITGRKERARELERYEALVKNTTDLITLVDEEGNILYQSPSSERVLGYDPEDAVGNNVFELLHPEDRERVEDEFSELIEDPDAEMEDSEYRFLSADGDYLWFEGSTTDRRDTNLDAFLIVARDITERKEREEELRKTKERLNLAIEGAELAVWDWSVADDEVTYNDLWAEILGMSPEDADYDVEFREDHAHPDDLPEVNEELEEHVAGETERFEAEYRMRTADGDWKWIHTAGQAVERCEDGRAERVVGVHMDIDDRKEREEELERYEAYIENSSDSITHIDEDGTIIYRNPSTERVEDEPEDMEGTGAFEHVHPDDEQRVREAFERVLNDPETDEVRVEYRSERADGSYEWVEAIATDQTDTDVGGVIANTRVVEERKERERELERYEAYIENSSDIVTHLDEDGTILYTSPSVDRVLGYESGERLGESSFEYIHPDDREEVAEKLSSLLEGDGEESQEVEMRYEDADGDYVWLESVGIDQRDSDIGGVVINSRDITEKKQRQKELERYEAFVENSSDVVTHVDEDGTVLYQSPSVENVFGYEQDETVGDYVFDYAHPDDREDILEEFYAIMEDPESDYGELEYRVRDADGDYIWVEAAGKDQSGTELGGFVVSQREITERKKYERNLERSQELMRNAEEIADTGGWEMDVETEEVRWTEGMYEIFGVPADYEPTLEDAIGAYHPDDRETVRRGVERCRDEGEPFDEELKLITDEDEQLWLRVRAEPVRENGETVSICGSVRDITEEKERERELLRNNMAVRGLYETTADPDLSFDDKVEMILESCRSRLDLGYAFLTEIDEEKGTQTVTHARGTHETLQPGESCPLQRAYCRETIESDGLLAVREATEDESVSEEAYDELGLGSYIGAKLSVEGELHGTLCFADTEPREEAFTEFERTLVELMAKWVSYELERKKSNERLRRQKERLDEFASVVSHDLRSPMTVLSGNLELAEETGDSGYFESCRNAIDRMERIMDDLLSLARDIDSTEEVERIDLAEVVGESWRGEYRKDAELRVETEGRILADEGKLRLMVDNLLRNSVEHGGDGVTITVKDLPDRTGFRVEDDGPGIPEDEREHVLEPGYSTRDGGTGLGMYIVTQVAEAHGWDVEVGESEEGGAAFDVTGVETVD